MRTLTMNAVTLGATVTIVIVATSTGVLAESWRAKAVLDSQAPAMCQQADVSKLFLGFTMTGAELSVQSTEGPVFSVPVSEDGSVAKTIVVPVGSKNFTVDLTGNARSRDMGVFNREYSCRFRLVPVP